MSHEEIKNTGATYTEIIRNHKSGRINMLRHLPSFDKIYPSEENFEQTVRKKKKSITQWL